MVFFQIMFSCCANLFHRHPKSIRREDKVVKVGGFEANNNQLPEIDEYLNTELAVPPSQKPVFYIDSGESTDNDGVQQGIYFSLLLLIVCIEKLLCKTLCNHVLYISQQ